MEKISKVVLPKELAEVFSQKTISSSSVASAEAYHADSLEHLMRIVAGISAYNPSYAVLFRGQSRDYRAGKATCILPSIYRGISSSSEEAAVELDRRFSRLGVASDLLAQALNGGETKKFVARRIQQWALIQHYEICETPLLDLTRSLRVACWFALSEASGGDSPVLYVFGMPYMHDRVALDSNCELFQMNLVSLLPPNAERPAFQEGVLAGYEQPDKKQQAIKNSDFSRRLLAKISLPRTDAFLNSIGLKKGLIYPEDDPYLPVAKIISAQLESNGVWSADDGLLENLLKSSESMAAAYTNAVQHLKRNMD